MLVFLAGIALLLFFLQGDTPNAPSDIGPIIALIIARSLQLSTIVKLVIDRFGQVFTITGPALFISAMVLGVLFDVAIVLLGGGGVSVKALVLALVSGVLAGIGSKALTDNHEASKP